MAQAPTPEPEPVLPSASPVPAAPSVSPPDILDDPLLAAVPVVDGAKRLGTCILIAKLGQGGMGAVYRAWHTRLNAPVAVKILPFHLATGPHAEAARQRFHREAQLAVQLDHPNLIRVMDVDESDQSLYYLIMEYVEGQTVGAALRRHLEKHNRPLPERTALSVIAQVASALAYAHGKGIIHRDIKPDNIMIRRDDGRVKVMDLGLAKSIDADEGVSMTSQGMGSPHYMSPEQASDAKHVTEASDVYSIGATLYHLVTGQTAFQAPSIYALVKKMHEDPPEDPRNYNPKLSEETRAIILRCLAKEPAQRYTAADLTKALRAAGERAPAASALRPAVDTVSPNGATLPSTATVPVSVQPTAAAASAAAARTQTAPARKGTRKPGAAVPSGAAAKSAPAPATIRPTPNRARFAILGAVGGLILVALLAFAWTQYIGAVEAKTRATTVDGILQQIQPRLAAKDYEQAEALFKTIPADADPDQIAATAQAVAAGVAARADELAFLRELEAKIQKTFDDLNRTVDQPGLQPTTRIVPLDAKRDCTPQLLATLDVTGIWHLDSDFNPNATARLNLKIEEGQIAHQIEACFHHRAGLLGYLDVLAADINLREPAFGVRLLKLSQGRFQKLLWTLQIKDDDGAVAGGTDLRMSATDQGEIHFSGHSIHLPDVTAVLRRLDGTPDETRPRGPGPGPGEHGDRKIVQKFNGSARLQAAVAGQTPVDGFSRLLGVLETVQGRNKPNFPALAMELTETVADLRLTLDQSGRAIHQVDFSAIPAPQNGLTLRALASAENRPAYLMLERLIPRLLFWMSIDPKNTNLMKVDRETDPAKMQSALILNLNNAGVQKMLTDMWNENAYNKPKP